MSFDGLTAVVTGGASGIGKAIATMLWEGGAKVMICDLNDQLGERVADEANSQYGNGKAIYRPIDVCSWTSTEKLFTAAATAFNGSLDMVFANAGAVKPGFPDLVGEPDLRVLDVNIKGTLLTVQGAVNVLRARSMPYVPHPDDSPVARAFRAKFRGKIVVTCSVTGLYATPCHVIYSASKHACVGAVRSLGPRLQKDHITVNGVAPNLVATSLSPGDMYETGQQENVITPVETVLDAFNLVLGDSELTGEIIEASFDKASIFVPAPFRDEQTKRSFDVLYQAYGVCERTRLPILKKEAEERMKAPQAA